MTERHPAIDGKNGGDDREAFAREVKSFQRREAGLLFVIDIEFSRGREHRIAAGRVLTTEARRLRGDLRNAHRPRIVHPQIRAQRCDHQQGETCQRGQQQTKR